MTLRITSPPYLPLLIASTRAVSRLSASLSRIFVTKITEARARSEYIEQTVAQWHVFLEVDAMNPALSRRSVVVCPTVHLPAAVNFDDSLILEACSRSPNLSCNKECVSQLRFSDDELENFVTVQHEQGWCQICGTVLTADDWYASRMAAISASHSRSVLATDELICWRCCQNLP